MARFSRELDENRKRFFAAEKVFFRATAPTEGRINLSPKGLDTLRVLSDPSVDYTNPTGSECGTAAHLAENGWMTVMFCSFEVKLLIVRLYGRRRTVRQLAPIGTMCTG